MVSDNLYEVLLPILTANGFDLVDVEIQAHNVTVFLDQPGGIDLDSLSRATRIVSAQLDEIDLFPGSYHLEVSSPGLERRLRTSQHFKKAIGEKVSVRILPGFNTVRRLQGVLKTADDEGFDLEGVDTPSGSIHVSYSMLDRARTLFDWDSASTTSSLRTPSRGKPPTSKKNSNSVAAVKPIATIERVSTS